MKTVAAVATALDCVASTTSATNNHIERELILSGEVVPAGTKTYVVGLRLDRDSDSLCGGALITPTHVLTASHCAIDAFHWASIGEHYRNGTEISEQIKIVSIMNHPNYSERVKNANDFMVVELERPSKYTPVKMAAADDSDFQAGKMATTMGWGTDAEMNGNFSYELQRVDVSLCYLKKGMGNRVSKIGLVSATVSSSSGATCSSKNGDYCGNSRGTSCCLDATYCQPWNSDYYQCKDVPAKCSTQLTDVNFNGNDMGVSFGGYPWDCCEKCTKTSGYVGYTFVNSDPRGPAGYLKSSLSGKKSSVGAVSGIINSLHVQTKIRSGAVQSKAVNLGAWFVSEYWMSWDSPLWKNVPVDTAWRGEYTVMKYLGKEKGTAAFEEHSKTWITETDISAIDHTGVLNTVRVPVGHWIIRDATDSPGTEADMYAPGGLKYIDTLINNWALKYNIAVVLSLHAHQGSQNGYESTSPPVNGETKWSTSETNIQNSIKFATFLAARYKDSPAFLGLSLMNGPNQPTDINALLRYYREAYKQIRATGNKCILFVSPFLSDQGPAGFTNFPSAPEYENVWNEIHAYFIWGYADKSEEWILNNLDYESQRARSLLVESN